MIGGCILLFLGFITLIPGLADIARWTNSEDGTTIRILMKINYMMMNLFTSKLYIPAMNVLINLKIEKAMRAGLNSIFYLGTTVLTIFLNKLNNVFMNLFFDDLVSPPTELYKYYALSIFIGF